jgi:glycosyl transferase family 87
LRRNLAIALAFAVLHAGAALAYHGDGKDLPATYFYPRAHAVAHGTDAYRGLDYEYPPATLPLLVAPLAAGGDDSGQAYHQRTIWLYGALDVVCVLLLAAFLRRRPSAELLLVLGLYSVSVLVLGRLALTRFDLAAGIAILIAGRCARSPGRAGAWLGLAGALKLVPLAAAPAMTRRGTSLRLLAAAAAVPIAVQVAYFLWSGEVGLSWIGYHAGRDPEIESWAAVLADLARGLGAHAGTAFDHGSQNVTGTTARWLGRIFAVASIGLALLLARRVRRVGADPALALLAALAVLVAVAPVLSPQYLLWLAPLSALLAPRCPLQAALLALTSVLTRLELHAAFDDLPHFEWGAIALVALRNVVLAALAVALWKAATAPGSGTPTRPAWPSRS